MQKSKVHPNDSLPLEKSLTFHVIMQLPPLKSNCQGELKKV